MNLYYSILYILLFYLPPNLLRASSRGWSTWRDLEFHRSMLRDLLNSWQRQCFVAQPFRCFHAKPNQIKRLAYKSITWPEESQISREWQLMAFCCDILINRLRRFDQMAMSPARPGGLECIAVEGDPGLVLESGERWTLDSLRCQA